MALISIFLRRYQHFVTVASVMGAQTHRIRHESHSRVQDIRMRSRTNGDVIRRRQFRDVFGLTSMAGRPAIEQDLQAMSLADRRGESNGSSPLRREAVCEARAPGIFIIRMLE